ncbi:RNA pseudouridine synthase 4, mitochondrial [Solanum stenotomum]|uniref:RNA pseudouridine synthase 4, mitochondrial n=1 Tax=Solanum stenotomum TaxID=172797 RepID=UPI0020D0A8E8|nr:RNA pseudouridine synthase 4, mitochondrial [Solanum stenotomum]
MKAQNPRRTTVMAGPWLLRRIVHRSRQLFAASEDVQTLYSAFYRFQCHYATTVTDAQVCNRNENEKAKWLTLPPFNATVNGADLGRELAGVKMDVKENSTNTMTALKWVQRCCPELPKSLVQKLFRLRQVRRDSSNVEEQRPKRVSAKESMNVGDRIFLPITVQKFPSEKVVDYPSSEEERKFVHSLELYKDPEIIVVNKPPGMPVQGGIGIKRSLDELAAKYMRHENSEAPRLVHRLDRDCSGLLVMGRTQLSASALHSIFREKTFDSQNEDLESKKRILQKKYWALVIGCPRRSGGIISAPLGKLVLDNGKSERITIMSDVRAPSAQYAVTEYRIIGSSEKGYTWLELSPLTGRKHQLRVHCAEALGTPIVGDYKYGWQAHRKLKHLPLPTSVLNLGVQIPRQKPDPFNLRLGNGSISDKQPHLHLHCKEMVLPNISLALQRAQVVSDADLVDVESIKLVAPLPFHMQKSWDCLSS